MPMETPQGISRRAPPPIFFHSGTPSQARLEVPHGRFESAARHIVPANVLRQRRDVGGAMRGRLPSTRGAT